MTVLIAARSLRGLATLLGVLALTFALGRLTGDPVALLLPDSATVADAQAMRARLGLDRPIPEQFAHYLGSVLRGDLGNSLVYNRPALGLVIERLPATLRLGGAAFVLAIALGIPLGVVAAVGRGRALDRTVRDTTLVLQSVPSFVIGILAVLLFGVTLQWLPTFGSDTPRHYVLPVITMALYPLALIVRLTRSGLLEVLGEDFVRTARAKGVPASRVVMGHALRNALVPVVTVLGLQLAGLIGGAVVIETVFAWPGVGSLAVAAINGRDFPIVQTVVVLSAAAFVAANLLVDLLYGVLDPRVRRA
jgi:peptide/nickel transport system permease protein